MTATPFVNIFFPAAPAASSAAAWLAAQSRTCLPPSPPSPPPWPPLRPRRETARRTAATSTPPAVSARDRPATPAATRITTTGRRGKAKCLKLPQKTRILFKNPVLFLKKIRPIPDWEALKTLFVAMYVFGSPGVFSYFAFFSLVRSRAPPSVKSASSAVVSSSGGKGGSGTGAGSSKHRAKGGPNKKESMPISGVS